MAEPGINAVGLDADRTRDELAAALSEVVRRLQPTHIRRSFALSFSRRPAPFISGGVGIAAGIASVIMLAAGVGRSRG